MKRLRTRNLIRSVALSGAVILFFSEGCGAIGVPKVEHDKVVTELNQVKQEKDSLAQQLTAESQAKQNLSATIQQFQSQVGELQRQNDGLKAQLAAATAPKSGKKK